MHKKINILTFASSKSFHSNYLREKICQSMLNTSNNNKSNNKCKKSYAITGGQERATSPSRMNKDIMWHVLYDNDMDLIRNITLRSAIRMEEYSSGDSEIVTMVKECTDSLTRLRVLFFLLLNVDDTLREEICSSQFCNSVWTTHGCPAPVDQYKATRFFQDFGVQCIHSWIRNESKCATYLLDELRMLYICC